MLQNIILIMTVSFLVLVLIIYFIIIRLITKKVSVSNKVIPYDLLKLNRIDRDFFERVSALLKDLGFEWDNDYKIEEDSTYTKSDKKLYIRRFIHKSLGTAAYICHTSIKQSNGNPKKATYEKNVKIETTFMSGFVIRSCMKIEPEIMNVQDEMRITCTNFGKVDELIQAHIDEVNKKVKNEPINFDVVRTPAEAYLNKSLRDIYMDQVKAGRMKFNTNMGWYKLTYRGAIRTLLKTCQFVLFQKSKIKRQTATGISYYPIKKMKPPLPLVMYNINCLVFLLFVLVHALFISKVIKSELLLSAMEITYVIALACLVISVIYKLINRKIE